MTMQLDVGYNDLRKEQRRPGSESRRRTNHHHNQKNATCAFYLLMVSDTGAYFDFLITVIEFSIKPTDFDNTYASIQE